jgi:hypothetical protein
MFNQQISPVTNKLRVKDMKNFTVDSPAFL